MRPTMAEEKKRPGWKSKPAWYEKKKAPVPEVGGTAHSKAVATLRSSVGVPSRARKADALDAVDVHRTLVKAELGSLGDAGADAATRARAAPRAVGVTLRTLQDAVPYLEDLDGGLSEDESSASDVEEGPKWIPEGGEGVAGGVEFSEEAWDTWAAKTAPVVAPREKRRRDAHRAAWGSAFKVNALKWAYNCCGSTDRDSLCGLYVKASKVIKQ